MIVVIRQLLAESFVNCYVWRRIVTEVFRERRRRGLCDESSEMDLKRNCFCPAKLCQQQQKQQQHLRKTCSNGAIPRSSTVSPLIEFAVVPRLNYASG